MSFSKVNKTTGELTQIAGITTGGGGETYTAGNGINIDENNVISSDAVIFTGTTDEWNALSLVEKIQYTHTSFIDDVGDGILDTVPTENSTNGITSGAVWLIKPIYLTATLSANNASVTFTNLPTTGNYIADFFIDDGSPYESIDASVSGQVTVTYTAKSVDRIVTCKLERM